MDTFEIPPKVSYPYIERYNFHTLMKIQKLSDLQPSMHFWNAAPAWNSRKTPNFSTQWPRYGWSLWVCRADSSFAPDQWETLLCNDVSHWLGTSLESALGMCMGNGMSFASSNSEKKLRQQICHIMRLSKIVKTFWSTSTRHGSYTCLAWASFTNTDLIQSQCG